MLTPECGYCGSTEIRNINDTDNQWCNDCGEVFDCNACLDTGTVWSNDAGMPAQCMDCGDIPDNYGEVMHRLAHPVIALDNR